MERFLLVILICSLATRAEAQPGDERDVTEPILIGLDRHISQLLLAAEDCIKDKDWDEAASALDASLRHGNVIVGIDKRLGGPCAARTEADRLLAAMPKEGREQYELRFGGKAVQLYDELAKAPSADAFFDLVRYYRYTKAGSRAAAIYDVLQLFGLCEPPQPLTLRGVILAKETGGAPVRRQVVFELALTEQTRIFIGRGVQRRKRSELTPGASVTCIISEACGRFIVEEVRQDR